MSLTLLFEWLEQAQFQSYNMVLFIWSYIVHMVLGIWVQSIDQHLVFLATRQLSTSLEIQYISLVRKSQKMLISQKG